MNRRSFIKTGLIFVPAYMAKAQFNSVGFLGSLGTTASTPPYNPVAVNFDGTNDYMLRGAGLTGAADGKKGTVSFWVKFNDDSASFETVFIGNYPAGGASGLGLGIYREAQGRMYVDAYNSAGTRILGVKSQAGGSFEFSVANGWRHFMCSWDLAITTVQMYINGVDAYETSGPIVTDDTIDYTQTQWAVGAFEDGTAKINACLSDLYVNTAERVDLATNGTKFYNGGPVNLGSNGSTPTGTAPIVFLNGDSSTFQTNAGTGGNFSVTGALTACSDAP